jgi:hypothetical protein
MRALVRQHYQLHTLEDYLRLQGTPDVAFNLAHVPMRLHNLYSGCQVAVQLRQAQVVSHAQAVLRRYEGFVSHDRPDIMTVYGGMKRNAVRTWSYKHSTSNFSLLARTCLE